MENNNYNNQQQYQQPQYQQTYQQPYQQQPQYTYQQPNDPAYMATVGEFLRNAIIACAISSLPVGSIIAIFMATKNRKNLLEYLDKGGLHTPRVKTSSCLSRAARYSGIGCTILWGIYVLYFVLVFVVMIITLIANTN